MASEPDLQRPLVPILASSRLAEMLGAVVSAFPTLDAESLHDFRKQLKSVRYLAEVAASGAAARQLAATVKSVQGTIGEWHDWEELAAEARRAFRNEEALVELLRILIAESFERALTVGESLKRQFLPAAAMVAIPAPPLKKLVQSAEAVAVHKQLISA